LERDPGEELDDGDDAPRWAGIRGVTGDPSRGRELGNAKWQQQARSLDEMSRELPTGPARDMDLSEASGGRSPWLLVLAGAIGVLVVFAGWRMSRPTPAPEAAPVVPTAPGVAESAPQHPTVTVTTDPLGARLFLDEADLGVAPAVVAVPLDDREHQLCVEREGMRTCRQLTGAALASSDPYVFLIR